MKTPYCGLKKGFFSSTPSSSTPKKIAAQSSKSETKNRAKNSDNNNPSTQPYRAVALKSVDGTTTLFRCNDNIDLAILASENQFLLPLLGDEGKKFVDREIDQILSNNASPPKKKFLFKQAITTLLFIHHHHVEKEKIMELAVLYMHQMSKEYERSKIFHNRAYLAKLCFDNFLEFTSTGLNAAILVELFTSDPSLQQREEPLKLAFFARSILEDSTSESFTHALDVLKLTVAATNPHYRVTTLEQENLDFINKTNTTAEYWYNKASTYLSNSTGDINQQLVKTMLYIYISFAITSNVPVGKALDYFT